MMNQCKNTVNHLPLYRCQNMSGDFEPWKLNVPCEDARLNTTQDILYPRRDYNVSYTCIQIHVIFV